MQNLYHDGGFSSMGMSKRAMFMYNKSLNCEDCALMEQEAYDNCLHSIRTNIILSTQNHHVPALTAEIVQQGSCSSTHCCALPSEA
ncbi:MAG: hypothetical protein U5L09_05255 [Bacteroidales bacterium]|nr:hypothetical protein [Bacteroidales bacterium]